MDGDANFSVVARLRPVNMHRAYRAVCQDSNSAKVRYNGAANKSDQYRSFRGWKVFNLREDAITGDPTPCVACVCCTRDLEPVENDNLEYATYECPQHSFFRVSGGFVNLIMTNLTPRYRPILDIDQLEDSDAAISEAADQLILDFPEEILDNKMTKGYSEDAQARDSELDNIISSFITSDAKKSSAGAKQGTAYTVSVDIRKNASGSLAKGVGYVRIWNASARPSTSYVELRDLGGNKEKLVKQLDVEYARL